MPKTTDLVVVIDSFWSPEGLISKGDLWAADDPLVRKYPSKFGPPKVHGAPAPAVEQATSAPGEKRVR